MKRFKKVLFVNDGKTKREMPLERAVNLAKRNQALLTVVEVLEGLPHDAQTFLKPADNEGIVKAAVQEITERLESLIAPIKEERVETTSKILLGTPFLEIIREVLRNKHDLVMLIPRKKAKLKDVLFGSRTMHLMRKCPCPVWAIKPTKRKKYARILAAVDPSPFDEERNALNIKIMEVATSLAELEGSELHVVHCWTPFIEARLRSRSGLTITEIDKLVRDIRKTYKMRFDQLLGRFNLNALPHKVHLLKGDPAALIVDLARKKRIELVVMGTVCRTGLAGFFIGNTAEKVLQGVDCSVLAVKPDGFVTPVRLNE
ncbi:MAG: universal stress protein [Syntrophaceae bacterium]|nr:universal stress protein [Syntrophaceae bacterium]